MTCPHCAELERGGKALIDSYVKRLVSWEFRNFVDPFDMTATLLARCGVRPISSA